MEWKARAVGELRDTGGPVPGTRRDRAGQVWEREHEGRPATRGDFPLSSRRKVPDGCEQRAHGIRPTWEEGAALLGWSRKFWRGKFSLEKVLTFLVIRPVRNQAGSKHHRDFCSIFSEHGSR